MNMSQETLAELSNLHPTYIGQLERGEKNASIESIEKICNGLKISIYELFKSIPNDDTFSNSDYPFEIYQTVLPLNNNEQKAIYDIIKSVLQFKQ